VENLTVTAPGTDELLAVGRYRRRRAAIPGGFATATDAGLYLTVVGGPFQRLDQSSGWGGNFSPGDALLFNTGHGPVVLSFTQPYVTAVGTQIAAWAFGPFTARIEALDSANNVLASFTFAGDATAAADGSAPFVGIRSDEPFARARFSLDWASDDPASFAINRVDVEHGAVIVPEPGSLVLAGLGAGLAACGWDWRRRRRSGPR
jgi:hypothetical protein